MTKPRTKNKKRPSEEPTRTIKTTYMVDAVNILEAAGLINDDSAWKWQPLYYKNPMPLLPPLRDLQVRYDETLKVIKIFRDIQMKLIIDRGSRVQTHSPDEPWYIEPNGTAMVKLHNVYPPSEHYNAAYQIYLLDAERPQPPPRDAAAFENLWFHREVVQKRRKIADMTMAQHYAKTLRMFNVTTKFIRTWPRHLYHPAMRDILTDIWNDHRDRAIPSDYNEHVY
jgi:hypothetical protein